MAAAVVLWLADGDLFALAALARDGFVEVAELDHMSEGDSAPARDDAFALGLAEFGGHDRAGRPDDDHAGVHDGDRRAIGEVNAESPKRLVVQAVDEVPDSHD